MAQAIANLLPIEPQFRTSEVTLKLTPEEAYTLLVLLDHTGGKPDNSPRKFADSVRVALEGALHVIPYKLHRKYLYNGSSITFLSDSLDTFREEMLKIDAVP